MVLPRLLCGITHVLALLMIGGVFFPSVAAATLKELGLFGEWSAYAFQENNNPVCYIASQPQKVDGTVFGRGDIHVLITHRPAEKAMGVFSIVAGYSYQEGSKVEVTVGQKTWTLFTGGERAWTPDAETDVAIANAIVKTGGVFTVRGVAISGEESLDTYSSTGAQAALAAISKECAEPKQDVPKDKQP